MRLLQGAVFGALIYLKLLANDLNDAPLRPHSVFEGVRQETKEFGRQNFIVYVVIDFVHDRLSSDLFETRFSGRVCYPQMHNAVSQVEGMVTNDGKVLRITELGGTFVNSHIEGYMPDTGHMAGVQVLSKFFLLFHGSFWLGSCAYCQLCQLTYSTIWIETGASKWQQISLHSGHITESDDGSENTRPDR